MMAMFKHAGVEAVESAVQCGRHGDLELEGLHQLDSAERSSETDSELDQSQPREIFHQSSV